MRKGFLVRGVGSMSRGKSHMNHHWADRGGRLYLCDCTRAIRLPARIKYCFLGRHKRTKISFERWLHLGEK